MVPAGEQVHGCGAMLQRHAGRIEGRGGGADHTDGLATEWIKVDRVLGMRVAGARQIGGEHRGMNGAPLPAKPVARIILRVVSVRAPSGV